MHIKDRKSGYLMGLKPVMVLMNFTPLMHIFWFGFYLAMWAERTILLMACIRGSALLKC